MCAYGTKRTCRSWQRMSAFGGKADMDCHHTAAPAKCDKYQDLYCKKLNFTSAISKRCVEATHEYCNCDRLGSCSGLGRCLFMDSLAAPAPKRFYHSFRFSCSIAKKSRHAKCKQNDHGHQ